MADHTAIEWTDATWNPITGCSVVSPGCTNCYAMRLAGTRLQHHPSRAGLTTLSKAGPVWNGHVRLNEDWLDQPLRWKRSRRIFVCAHGDLFHENVPDDWIDRVFVVMAAAPQHTFQVLTKRPDRMREWFAGIEGKADDRLFHAARAFGMSDEAACAVANWVNGYSRWRRARADGNPLDGSVGRWPLPNVWLGVSAEDQQRADERISPLLKTPAVVRFLSCEPMLNSMPTMSAWLTGGRTCTGRRRVGIDWVICGGESGPGARSMHPDWARSLRDQCFDAMVPFFMKQMAKKAPIPADLQVRQWPRSAADMAGADS